MVEERLLGFRQQMRAVAAYLGKREAIRGERGLFVEEPLSRSSGIARISGLRKAVLASTSDSSVLSASQAALSFRFWRSADAVALVLGERVWTESFFCKALNSCCAELS